MAKAPKPDLPGCYELECEKFAGVENPVAKRRRRARRGPKTHTRKKKKPKHYF